VRVVKGDARNIPFDDNRFHFVISTACVKHIPGDGDTLAIREMLRVCRPGGLVAVSFDFGKEDAEYPSAATRRRIYDKRAVYERLVKPSGGILEEPADFDRANWNDWPIKEQCREIYDKGVNVQVGFILLRKP
jgi:ubiquinone/menaquinone biosynthesis C-methylase UbiE